MKQPLQRSCRIPSTRSVRRGGRWRDNPPAPPPQARVTMQSAVSPIPRFGRRSLPAPALAEARTISQMTAAAQEYHFVQQCPPRSFVWSEAGLAVRPAGNPHYARGVPRRVLAALRAGSGRSLWYWLRGQDSNLRPSGYGPDELPDCSTPRHSSSSPPAPGTGGALKPSPVSLPSSGFIGSPAAFRR